MYIYIYKRERERRSMLTKSFKRFYSYYYFSNNFGKMVFPNTHLSLLTIISYQKQKKKSITFSKETTQGEVDSCLFLMLNKHRQPQQKFKLWC